jgi:hypothetical protein
MHRSNLLMLIVCDLKAQNCVESELMCECDVHLQYQDSKLRRERAHWRAPRLGPEVGRMQARDKNREFTACDKGYGENVWKR